MSTDETFQRTLSSDMRFLITCCQVDLSETEIAWLSSYITVKSPDFSPIIEQANLHGVTPLVYKTLKDLQVQHNIDEALLRDLKTLYTHIIIISKIHTVPLIYNFSTF